MTKKNILSLLTFVSILLSCDGWPTSQPLVKIESWLAEGRNDHAYYYISKYDAASFQKEEDRAYYNLLMTRATIERGLNPPSDSLINEAIRYYKIAGDRERLACCYYYKGEYYINLKEWPRAIQIMKRAEEQVVQAENRWLKYKIYDAIGRINQQCGNYRLGVEYIEKAKEYASPDELGEYIDDFDVPRRDSLHQAKERIDHTVLELQWQFDEQKAQEAHRQHLIWAAVALVFLLFIIILLVLYIRYRRAKERLVLTEQQMQISSYINEIAQLKSKQADSDTTQQIEELNSRIRELVEKESPRLVRGKLLYDDIRKNGTTSGWSNDDYKCFIDYYKAIDFAAYSRILKKYQPKTAHNTFFLILYEMGMEDKDVRRIMGITQEAIRSTRYRIRN
jgi:hypothetical protein